MVAQRLPLEFVVGIDGISEVAFMASGNGSSMESVNQEVVPNGQEDVVVVDDSQSGTSSSVDPMGDPLAENQSSVVTEQVVEDVVQEQNAVEEAAEEEEEEEDKQTQSTTINFQNQPVLDPSGFAPVVNSGSGGGGGMPPTTTSKPKATTAGLFGSFTPFAIYGALAFGSLLVIKVLSK